MKKIKLYLRPLNKDTKLFAICKKNGWPLRITMFKEALKLWNSDYIIVMDCKIKIIDEKS